MLIDSHCHLSSEDVYVQLDNVMNRAADAGVNYMLNAGGLFDELPLQLEICRQYPNVFTLTGVHPHNATAYAGITVDDVLKNTAYDEVVGIGECGLDYFYDFSPRDLQIKVFRRMIKAAQESALPLVVHTREADDDMAEILTESYHQKPFNGVIHCYSSGWNVAEAALKIGFYISASGIITFKKSEDLRQAFKKIPLQRLLVETDSPYLAPVPLRGQINEPANVIHTAACLAEIKGLDLTKISAITSNNFFELFAKAKKQTNKKINK